jgi:hypothetical protein
MFRLSIHDVQRRLHEKSEKKQLCYDKVLDICHKRIIASTDREKTHCYFEFPEYVIGFPLFDLNACMEHCKKNLIASGFLVKYHFPSKFYISWDVDEIKEHKTIQRRNTPLTALLPQGISAKKPTQKQLPSIEMHQSTQGAKSALQPKTENTHSVSPQVSVNISTDPLQDMLSQIPTPTTNLMNASKPLQRPSVFNTMSFDMYKKITQPLPTTQLRYDPNDIPCTADAKANVIDNTFFPNHLKQLLTSDIGSNNKKVSQKQSGKLSLNI